jgi:diadenosine tetraphosphate (Ap4A) HIT family hydrolase
MQCSICARIGRGHDLVLEDEHVVVEHLEPQAGGTAYLGYLFVETRRHVAALDELTTEEAAAVGRAAARTARALRDAAGAEHVYAAVIGHHTPHFHLHVIARYPGTPREYWWVRVDEWPDAPRGDAQAIAAFCERLRAITASRSA